MYILLLTWGTKKKICYQEGITVAPLSVYSMQTKLLDYRLQHYMSLLKYMEPHT